MIDGNAYENTKKCWSALLVRGARATSDSANRTIVTLAHFSGGTRSLEFYKNSLATNMNRGGQRRCQQHQGEDRHRGWLGLESDG